MGLPVRPTGRRRWVLVLLALQVDRLVVVETGTRYGMAWHGLFARSGVRTVNLVTPDGSTQPAPLEKGEMH